MQVCTDRSLSQRRQEQNLRTPTSPTPTLPQGLKMNPSPVHLSAFKPGTLLMAQTYFSARKQGTGTFCFRKLYSPFSCPTLSSLTEIQREVEKKELPFHKAQKQYSGRAWSPVSQPHSSNCNPCFLQAQSPIAGKSTSEPHLGSGFSKTLPKFPNYYLNSSLMHHYQCFDPPPSGHCYTPPPHPPLPYDSLIQMSPSNYAKLTPLQSSLLLPFKSFFLRSPIIGTPLSFLYSANPPLPTLPPTAPPEKSLSISHPP